MVGGGGNLRGDQVLGEEQQLPAEPAPAVASLWGETPGTPPMHPLPGESSFGEGMNLHQAGGMMGGRGSGAGRGGVHPALPKRSGGGIQVGDHTGFLRMRGLPFSAAKEDILKFFMGYNPVPESIVLTYRNDGRATGEAYIGFASPDDSKNAMDLHRRTMGARYIELFISNKEEHGRALARFGNR